MAVVKARHESCRAAVYATVPLRSTHIEPCRALVPAQHRHLMIMVRRDVAIGFDRDDCVGRGPFTRRRAPYPGEINKTRRKL